MLPSNWAIEMKSKLSISDEQCVITYFLNSSLPNLITNRPVNSQVKCCLLLSSVVRNCVSKGTKVLQSDTLTIYDGNSTADLQN